VDPLLRRPPSDDWATLHDRLADAHPSVPQETVDREFDLSRRAALRFGVASDEARDIVWNLTCRRLRLIALGAAASTGVQERGPSLRNTAGTPRAAASTDAHVSALPCQAHHRQDGGDEHHLWQRERRRRT
jgi:hypothetical protein